MQAAAYLAALAVIGYHVAPMWREIHSWGGTRDWGYFFFLAEVDRKTILEYGQFPLWNPYYCGGAVHLANPQTYFLSLSLPLILAFGPALGIRLMLTLGLVLGFEGVRRLCRANGLHPIAAIVAGTGYAVSGALAQHLGGGHIGWIGFCVLPWVLLTFDRWIEGRTRHVLYGGLLLAWIFGHFGVYPYPYACLTLGFYGLARGIAAKKFLRAIAGIAAMVALSLGFAALRLLPILDFIRDHPRKVVDPDILKLAELWEIYAVRHTARHFGQHIWVWPEYGNYFGVIGVGLVAIGAIAALVRKDRRALWPMVFGTVVFIVFQLGNREWFPWWMLKKLPVIENLRVPSRFTTVVAIFACVLIGVAVDQGLRWAQRNERRRALRYAAAALTLAVALAYVFDASSFNRLQWNQTFGTPPPAVTNRTPFRQAMGDPNRMYLYPAQNQGSLRCFEESPLDISKKLAVGRPKEEFLAPPGVGTVDRVRWSPNRIIVEADLPQPGRVVVNQNYERHWKVTEGGEVTSHQGLLAADVPAGRRFVVFRYLPTPFLWGLGISCATFLLAGYLWRRWRPRRESELGRTALP